MNSHNHANVTIEELIAPLDLENWEARLDDRASVAVPLVRALIQRLREAEAERDRLRADELTNWKAIKARIAQLERVHEAALNLRGSGEIHKALPLLYDALAAMESEK